MSTFTNYDETKTEIVNFVNALLERRGITGDAGIYSFFLMFISILRMQMRLYKVKKIKPRKYLNEEASKKREEEFKQAEERKKRMMLEINRICQEIMDFSSKSNDEGRKSKEGEELPLVRKTVDSAEKKEKSLVACEAANAFVKKEIEPLTEEVEKKKDEIENLEDKIQQTAEEMGRMNREIGQVKKALGAQILINNTLEIEVERNKTSFQRYLEGGWKGSTIFEHAESLTGENEEDPEKTHEIPEEEIDKMIFKANNCGADEKNVFEIAFSDT